MSNPLSAVCNNDDYNRSTRLLAATTLRNVLGTRNLSEILSDREAIADTMHHGLEEATNPWGVHVDRVEIKDVRLPQQLQRAMAAEAEATREARAKVIAAEGEQKSSKALKEAADIIAMSPAALQLRYLQVRGQSWEQGILMLTSLDPQLHLRREELHHYIPAAHGDVQHLRWCQKASGQHIRGLRHLYLDGQFSLDLSPPPLCFKCFQDITFNHSILYIFLYQFLVNIYLHFF